MIYPILINHIISRFVTVGKLRLGRDQGDPEKMVYLELVT